MYSNSNRSARLTRGYRRINIDLWQAGWLGIEEVTLLAADCSGWSTDEQRIIQQRRGGKRREMWGIVPGDRGVGFHINCRLCRSDPSQHIRTSDSSWGFRLVSNESVSQIDSKTRLGAQTSCDLWDAAQRAFMYSVRTLLHRLHRLFAACVFAVGRRGCSEDDWLCRVCSRGQVSYLHLLAQKMLRSAPFGRSICSPNTRTTLCFSFANLSLLFSPHYSSSVPFFLLFRNSLQSKKNTQIPPRYPWYVMFSLYSIFFLF